VVNKIHQVIDFGILSSNNYDICSLNFGFILKTGNPSIDQYHHLELILQTLNKD